MAAAAEKRSAAADLGEDDLPPLPEPALPDARPSPTAFSSPASAAPAS